METVQDGREAGSQCRRKLRSVPLRITFAAPKLKEWTFLSKMAILISSLIILTQFLLYLNPAYCMEVDFCIPVRVDHQRHEKHLHRRAEEIEERQIVFRLSAFKQEFYLQLTPDSSFLAPGSLPLESSSSASNETSDLRECFYSGNVNAEPDSFAALSLCKGLHGGFSYNGMEYFISLTGSEDAASGFGNSFDRTHIIRRRRRAASPRHRCR